MSEVVASAEVTEELPALNEAEISRALVRFGGWFPPRRFLAVENVSWGLLPWEADLLIMPASAYLYEVEIKVSVADLRRDQHKRKHALIEQDRERPLGSGYGHNSFIRKFWYAAPQEVWDKAEPWPIPAHAGVFAVYADTGMDKVRRWYVKELRKPKTNAAAKPLTIDDQYQLARLGVLRYWDRKRKP